jgi:hypothetical protein
MDIRKPKPIRNWREFLTEVGTIVLGVSIALAAEQGVEWIHWRNQVQEARQLIATEMAGNTSSAIARLRTQDCIEHRLDELSQILDAASRSGSLAPVGYIAMPPRRGWGTGAWEGVLASQVATHFTRQQLNGLGRIYNVVRVTNAMAPLELETWSVLGTITGPGRRLDPASEADLRKAISVARSYNRNMANTSFQMLRALKPLNLPFDEYDKRAMIHARDESLAVGKITAADSFPMYLICQPIGAAPPQYGQTPMPKQPGVTEEGMKLLPNLGAQ